MQISQLQKRIKELSNLYPITKYYCKKIFTLISHLKIHTLNSNIEQYDRIFEILQLLTLDYGIKYKLLTLDTQIMLLFNCLKYLLGAKDITRQQEIALNQYYQAYGVKGNNVRLYQEHLLFLFFIIKALVFRKGQTMEEGNGQGQDSEEGVQGKNVVLEERLGSWVSVCLEETSLSLEEVSRNIIRHRIPSLATVVGLKLGLPQFCLSLLELMHDGPFNNQAQTIKLCFQLFQARQYQKLHNSLQVLLSAATCKNLRQRQVLLSMCGIFTGLYLQNRQQALLYSKLNHAQNKLLILRQETLWQQVGFAYLNLAIHEIYLCNRENFLTQALRCLLKSLEINPNNYLAQYCVGKIYLVQFDYQGAYKHAMQSCKSGRGEWVPFCLLSCVYYCQKRISKATVIIEQLLKKYSYAKPLYYSRAYLQANRVLLQVQHDEQVQAAKELGQDIYQLCRQKVLKNKVFSDLIKYCQQYHQVCIGLIPSDYDEDYFTEHIASLDQYFTTETREGLGYKQGASEQALLQIIPLMLQVGLLNLSEGLLKTLPLSPLRSFYRAILHQLKKEKSQAMQLYLSILKQQPYHTQTLINLALIQKNPSEGLHQLDIAEKFVNNGKIWFAKGVLLSKLGRVEEATNLLLREGEEGWLEQQPDLLYYY